MGGLLQLGALMWVLGANPALHRGRALYDDVQYQAAAEALSLAAHAPGITPAERTEALDLWARSLVALGRSADAETVYTELLTADPEASLGAGAAPKIAKLFQGVKRRLFPGEAVTLEPIASPPGTLAFRVTDPWRLISSALLRGNTEHPLAIEAHDLHFEVPREAATLELRAANGRVLQRRDIAAAPLEPVASPAAPALSEKPRSRLPPWVGWSTFGLGAATALAGGVLAWTAENAYATAGSASSAAAVRAGDASYHSQKVASNALLISGGAVALAGLTLRWKF